MAVAHEEIDVAVRLDLEIEPAVVVVSRRSIRLEAKHGLMVPVNWSVTVHLCPDGEVTDGKRAWP